MRAVLICPDPEYPIIFRGSPACSGGSPVDTAPFFTGMADLTWGDTSLLIGSLLLSCSIAVCFNILSKQFHRGG
jgi:hypothetical protein